MTSRLIRVLPVVDDAGRLCWRLPDIDAPFIGDVLRVYEPIIVLRKDAPRWRVVSSWIGITPADPSSGV